MYTFSGNQQIFLTIIPFSRPKPIFATNTLQSVNKDKNKLGLLTSTSLIVGNMIGAGIFLAPAALSSFGSVSLLGWVISAIGCFFLVKIFGNLSRIVPNVTGGPYAYTRRGFGDYMGFSIAWGYYIAVACANAAITVGFVSALSTFIPVLSTSTFAAVFTGLSSIWLLTWINNAGVRVSGGVQLTTTILKLIPLIAVAFGGLFFIRTDNFPPFNNTSTSLFEVLSNTVTFTMFAFVGIESATVPADKVANPQKTIPRATMLGLIIVTIVYILGTVSVMGIIPPEQLQRSLTPFADAAEIMWGPNARFLVSAGVAIAAFGALNGWILIQGQLPFAIAKDNLFPRIFGKENKKGVPYVGMFFSSILISIFMIMNYNKGLVDQFKFLVLLSTLSVLIPYLFSTASYFILRTTGQQLTTGEWVQCILLFVISFSYVFWAIASAGQKTIFYGFLLQMTGIPLYLWMTAKNQSRTDNML
ncbi:amino acid permease [Chitinophaga agri]|uniref:Arginine/agmatine antiporter n=1 Tax=Chitinophaga agri TaxID=2703787 RepID=A0A6B9ZJS3_9BACT|nr:amino acid permease [Chitinophaga agri]